MVIAPVVGPDAQERARRELQRGEYHRDDPGPVRHLLDWVGDRVADLFGGGPGGNAVLVLLVLLVGVAVAFAVRAGRPQLRRRRHGAEAEPDPLATDSADAHRRAAAAMQRDGRRADALREWLRAAVATIEERGVLAPRPGRTGAATAREAGPALPAVAADLAAAVTAFEQVWFGGRDATDADVALARRVADAVASTRLAAAAEVGAELRW